MKWLWRALLVLVAVPLCAALVLFLPIMMGRLSSPAQVTLPGGLVELDDGHVNVFMVRTGGDSVILFDCGEDREAKVVLAELKRLGLDRGAVKDIFLTHGHPDHVGGCGQFPGANVYTMVAERPLVEGKVAPRSPFARVMGPLGDRAIKTTVPMSEGQIVRAGSVTVRAMGLPGHTAGSAAFLVVGDLILGDAAVATSGRGIRPAEWLFSDDKPAAIRSLKRLALQLEAEGAPINAVAFSHSGPLDSLKPLLDWAHRN